MLSIEEIKKQYPDNLHPFKSFLLREYLQFKLLEIIFESEYADKLSFLGGTNLRIVHNNTRFSEDLDFDNFNLSEDEFGQLSEIISQKLSLLGYEVEIKKVYKGAFHCYIKFPKLLYNEGLSGHINQKILIQIDTEPHNYDYKVKRHILNKFDVFTAIFTTPKDILLAQKFYALVNRKRKKGRDFFDILFLLKTTTPNYDYLNQKLAVQNSSQLKSVILKTLQTIDMQEMIKDVNPFVFYPKELKKMVLFEEYIKQLF